MALDEVIRQLIEVRAKMQQAQGLTGAAEDSLRDSASQARDALQGTGNPAALDGLGMYDQVENDLGEVLAALTEVDRNIARYIDFASPGHASGKQNVDIPRPTGETIVRQSQEGTKAQGLLQTLTEKGGDVEDGTKTSVQIVTNLFNGMKPADKQPPGGTGVHTSTSTETHHPSIGKPPVAPIDGAQGLMAVMVAGAVVTKAAITLNNAWKAWNERRRNDE